MVLALLIYTISLRLTVNTCFLQVSTFIDGPPFFVISCSLRIILPCRESFMLYPSLVHSAWPVSSLSMTCNRPHLRSVCFCSVPCRSSLSSYITEDNVRERRCLLECGTRHLPCRVLLIRRLSQTRLTVKRGPGMLCRWTEETSKSGLSNPSSIRPCRAFGKLGSPFSQLNLQEVIRIERISITIVCSRCSHGTVHPLPSNA